MREEQAAPGLHACAETEARRLLAAAFETAPVKPGLAAGLVAAANPHGPASPASDVVGQVRKRAARERRRRVLAPAGAVALAAAIASGVTAGAVPGAGTAPAPDAALTAAMVKTSEQSFTFTETARITVSPGSRHTTSAAGEFDPVTRTGWTSVDGTGQVLRVLWAGGHEYVRMRPHNPLAHGKLWIEHPQPTAPLTANPARLLPLITWGFYANADSVGGPADLLALLKSATSVRGEGPASGPGWTGTKYGFTVNDAGPAFNSISGTVSVDSSGRVRQLVTVLQGQAGATTMVNQVTIAFGGFGTPVSVTPPPASQVYVQKY